jgi:hypothetical protein
MWSDIVILCNNQLSITEDCPEQGQSFSFKVTAYETEKIFPAGK